MAKPITQWSEVIERIESFRDRRWIFRGEDEAKRPLKNSLERLAIDHWRCKFTDLPKIEDGLVRRFKREAPRFLVHQPRRNDWIGWLGLMRHHGAPTRLLDCTYSFFVALYFALRGVKPGRKCSVRAICVDWIEERTHGPHGVLDDVAKGAVVQDPNVMRPRTIDLMMRREDPIALVYPLNPFDLHERLVLQQGIFLVPGDVSVPFMDNIRALGPPGDNIQEIEFRASKDFLKFATRELARMNVSEATLFPGIDGFARNLNAVIPFPELRSCDKSDSRNR